MDRDLGGGPAVHYLQDQRHLVHVIQAQDRFANLEKLDGVAVLDDRLVFRQQAVDIDGRELLAVIKPRMLATADLEQPAIQRARIP